MHKHSIQLLLQEPNKHATCCKRVKVHQMCMCTMFVTLCQKCRRDWYDNASLSYADYGKMPNTKPPTPQMLQWPNIIQQKKLLARKDGWRPLTELQRRRQFQHVVVFVLADFQWQTGYHKYHPFLPSPNRVKHLAYIHVRVNTSVVVLWNAWSFMSSGQVLYKTA